MRAAVRVAEAEVGRRRLAVHTGGVGGGGWLSTQPKLAVHGSVAVRLRFGWRRLTVRGVAGHKAVAPGRPRRLWLSWLSTCEGRDSPSRPRSHAAHAKWAAMLAVHSPNTQPEQFREKLAVHAPSAEQSREKLAVHAPRAHPAWQPRDAGESAAARSRGSRPFAPVDQLIGWGRSERCRRLPSFRRRGQALPPPGFRQEVDAEWHPASKGASEPSPPAWRWPHDPLTSNCQHP